MMEQLSMFDYKETMSPLASRLRPESLETFVGQKHLLGKGKLLRQLIDQDQIPSMIFWGPPGVGKTTLASIIAKRTNADFVNFSAVTSGIKEIKEVMARAELSRRSGLRTLVFVDEIHRFNKAQQDAFLPYVEKGSIILIGATTENPSFEINAALLSRCRVFVLQPLSTDDLTELLHHALKSSRGLGYLNVEIGEELIAAIAAFANGDARTALNVLEMAVTNGTITPEKTIVTRDILEQCISKKSLLYDKNGEEHYNLISALHKSMRNSDPDAAVYWLARMLEAGEDPRDIARRLIRFATEDIGLADNNALTLAVSVYQACHFLGMPECNIHLTHAVVYLSLAPRSNSVYMAYEHAKKDALNMLSEPSPGDPQRAHRAYEGAGLREGLRLRPPHEGKDRPHGMSARILKGNPVLHSWRGGKRKNRQNGLKRCRGSGRMENRPLMQDNPPLPCMKKADGWASLPFQPSALRISGNPWGFRTAGTRIQPDPAIISSPVIASTFTAAKAPVFLPGRRKPLQREPYGSPAPRRHRYKTGPQAWRGSRCPRPWSRSPGSDSWGCGARR